MTHEEMITLISNMFINAYVAGDRKDLESFRSARADRDHLFDAIRDLYAELEHESYEREQFEVELQKAQHELEERRRTHAKLNMDEIYGKKISHVDDRSLYPSRKPDDLPFPDVEDLLLPRK